MATRTVPMPDDGDSGAGLKQASRHHDGADHHGDGDGSHTADALSPGGVDMGSGVGMVALATPDQPQQRDGINQADTAAAPSMPDRDGGGGGGGGGGTGGGGTGGGGTGGGGGAAAAAAAGGGKDSGVNLQLSRLAAHPSAESYASVLATPTRSRASPVPLPSGPGARRGPATRKWVDLAAHARTPVAGGGGAGRATAAVSPAATAAEEDHLALEMHDTRERYADLDLTDAASRLGLASEGQLLQYVSDRYDVDDATRSRVADQVARDDLSARRDGEHLTLRTLLPAAVGKVKVKEWAANSKLKPEQYVAGFMRGHGMRNPMEVYQAMAFVAAGYDLEEAKRAVVAEREGHEYIKYRHLVWVTVSVVEEPRVWRALPGVLAMLLVATHGVFACIAVLGGSNLLSLNPDQLPPRAFTDLPFEDYWDWLTSPSSHAGEQWFCLRLWRLFGVTIGVAGVVDMLLNTCSRTFTSRVAERGLFDTYPNRLLRFFNTFACVTAAGNVWLMVVLHRDNHDPATGDVAWMVLSVLAALFLQSYFFAYDSETVPVEFDNVLKVVVVDLLTNWLLLARVILVCLVFLALLPITLLVALLAIGRLLTTGCCGEMCESCCGTHSCTHALVATWVNFLAKLLEEGLF